MAVNISKKQIAIFYIEKNKATLFRLGHDDPIMVSFPQTVVTNLEVIDKTKLEQIITNSIAKNEIKPVNIFVVLSKDILFEKEINDVALSAQNEETEKFLDIVPFHYILTKTYNFSKKTIIVAADRDFCESIVSIFKENSFPVVGMLPLSIFEEKVPLMREEFNIKLALQKVENLKRYSLPLDLEQEVKSISYDLPSFKNIKFIALVGVFTLLLTILGIQVYLQFFKTAKTLPVKQYEINTLTTPTASPSAAITPVVLPKR